MKRGFLIKVIIGAMVMSTIANFSLIGIRNVSAADTMPVNGWYKDEYKWNYFKNGIKVNGWLNTTNKWYYFYDDGTMAYGMIEDNGNKYHTDSNGVLIKGWLKEWDMWYYFNDNYLMETGWSKINNVWHYFYNDGSMAVNTMIDNYYVNEFGELANKPKKEDNKITYEDAIAKGINAMFGNYDYVTPVKFNRGPVIQDDFTFNGLIAEEDKDKTSREVLLSTEPLTKDNATDFDLISKDSWIVASATLQKDGSYHITGQFYSVRLGMGKSRITYDPEATSEASQDSYIIVNSDGSVELKGNITKNN